MVHDLLLYQGVSTSMLSSCWLWQSSDNVMEIHKQPHLSVVFFDNFFASFDLIQKPQTEMGIRCIGTVRPNLTGGATVMWDNWTLATSLGQAQAVQSVSQRCVQMAVPEIQCVPLLQWKPAKIRLIIMLFMFVPSIICILLESSYFLVYVCIKTHLPSRLISTVWLRCELKKILFIVVDVAPIK